MPFDILPVLEYWKELVSQKENVQGVDVLINWLILKYLPPNEDILFEVEQNEKKSKENLNMQELMWLYQFRQESAGYCETYTFLPPESIVYVPFEPEKAHKEQAHFQRCNSLMGKMDQGTNSIFSTISKLIDNYYEQENPECLLLLSEYINFIQSEILPGCPLETAASLRDQILFANQILSSQQGSYGESLPPSPETARRQRRMEKEKME